jgi:D-sedoheptulose 7-phosphate isomerase
VVQFCEDNCLSIQSVIIKNLSDSIAAKEDFLKNQQSQAALIAAIERVIACYKLGGRLYIAGNGGSAADAQHLATEFVSRLAKDRNALPAEALTTDSSLLTAIGNDYGFEKIFSRQLQAKASGKDVFLGITTSGRSPNVLEALKECRKLGVTSVVFTGPDGNDAKQLADHCVASPSNRTSTIQELHIVFAHTLCECVENAMFAD